MLKSINNLKKEVQKSKFEQKENVRIQKIARLEKDLAIMDIAMDALRKLVNHQGKCDEAITAAVEKGIKRVRIASREELKMEINKYKSISIKAIAELKKHGIKTPAYAAKANLNEVETGLRNIAEEDKG